MTITIRVKGTTQSSDARPHRQHALRIAAVLIGLTALGLPAAAAAQTATTPFETQVRNRADATGARELEIPDGVFAQSRPPRESRRPTRLPPQQYLASPAARGLADGNCSAPYKIASGACVLSCPGGFDDRGSVCISRRD